MHRRREYSGTGVFHVQDFCTVNSDSYKVLEGFENELKDHDTPYSGAGVARPLAVK